jgi:hypothetical protein
MPPSTHNTTPTFSQLTIPSPAHLPMHLPLQNRQRHRLPPAHLRLPLHPQHIPLPTPLVFTIQPLSTLAHPPDSEREPQPHHQPTHRKTGERSRNRRRAAAGRVREVGERSQRSRRRRRGRWGSREARRGRDCVSLLLIPSLPQSLVQC